MVKAENGASHAYRVGRELGKRALRSFAAIREPNELVVVQRFVAGANPKLLRSDGVNTLGVDAMNQLLRDAECLARNWHPNIARVKHVDGDAMKLTIATDLVDGMTLGDLFAAAPLLPCPVIVRVLVDVLAGLNALHALRDGTRAAGTIHGAVCPANIVVGRDGVARIVNCLRPRPVRADERSEALAYAAPEALDEGGTKDGRADVYAVGVILWQALMGIVPYEAGDPVQLLARQRSEEVVTPPGDAGSKFAGLGEIAIRAMAFEPSLRYRTTAEMAATLRKLAGTEIATGTVIAAKVAELAGDRIRARRAELDPKAVAVKRRAAESSGLRAAPVAVPLEESSPAGAMDLDWSTEAAPITARAQAFDAPAAAKKARAVVAPTASADPERETVLAPMREAALGAPLADPARDAPPALPLAPPAHTRERTQAPPGPAAIASVIVAPTSSAPMHAAAPSVPSFPALLAPAAPVAAPPSAVLTPAAVFQPGVAPPSLPASEAPPPRRRRGRAVALLLLGASLVILLVAGVRTLGTNRDPALGAGAAAPGTTAAPTAAASTAAASTPDTAPPPDTAPAPVIAAEPRGSGANVPAAARVEPRPAAKKKSYDPLGI